MKKRELNLKEIQAACLELLKEFDRVCREHGLRYSLAAGTLLGAVRHKGFIPWDDDVDVYMSRPDYEKFRRLVLEEHVLPDHLTISKDRGKGTYYCFTKLLDTRYILKCHNHIEVKHLFLDVFPVDGVPSDREEREEMYRKEKRWVIASGICQWYTMDRWWGFIAYVIGWWFYLLFNLFVPRALTVRKMNAYALAHPYESAEKVAYHNYGFSCETVSKEAYENPVELEFEGGNYMAMSEWDIYLRGKFGDYMQLPPERKRRSRHYMKIYKKGE